MFTERWTMVEVGRGSEKRRMNGKKGKEWRVVYSKKAKYKVYLYTTTPITDSDKGGDRRERVPFSKGKRMEPPNRDIYKWVGVRVSVGISQTTTLCQTESIEITPPEQYFDGPGMVQLATHQLSEANTLRDIPPSHPGAMA